MTDHLAEAIWRASREDEGTISATGADKVASAVRAYLLAGKSVARAAYAMYANRPLELDQTGSDDWLILPEGWKQEWLDGARTAMEGALCARNTRPICDGCDGPPHEHGCPYVGLDDAEGEQDAAESRGDA